MKSPIVFLPLVLLGVAAAPISPAAAGAARPAIVRPGAALDDEWAKGIPWITDWKDAIAKVRATGKMLFIYNGWPEKGTCKPCDALKQAIGIVAAGKDDFAPMRDHLKSKFVCLNVHVGSEPDETAPRGPEGPYRFQEKSVPVLVIKRWDGKTLVSQCGFTTDGEAGAESVAGMIEEAVEANGPIIEPKRLLALERSWEKVEKELEKQRFGQAYEQLAKIVAAGADREAFPAGSPEPSVRAEEKRKELKAELAAKLAEIEKIAQRDATEAKVELQRLLRSYRASKELREMIEAVRPK